MCEPTTLAAASLAVGVAQAGMGYMAQQEEAANQRAYQEQARANAEQARQYDMQQLTLRQSQEGEKTGQQMFEARLDAAKRRSTAEVALGERGVVGESIDSIARDYFAQEGRNEASLLRNNTSVINQLQVEKDGATSRYVERTTFKPIKDPSALGLGLGIASAGVNAADLYYRRKPADNSTKVT